MKHTKKSKADRQLTVQPFYAFTLDRNNVYSEIRFRGKWVKEAGFNPHEKVALVVTRGQIIIKNKTGI